MSPPNEDSGGSIRVGERLAVHAFRFDLADLQRYAAASGDNNPIHLDAEFARRVGLEAPPVHGMLLMSCFEPALQAWRADFVLCRLSAKFLRPVFAGEKVEISGRVVEMSEDAAQAILRLLVHSERREIVIVAEASLVKRAAR